MTATALRLMSLLLAGGIALAPAVAQPMSDEPRPAPTAPAVPALMSPTSKWVVSGEKQRCMATRQYGDAAAPILLALLPSPMRDGVRITLVDPVGTKGFIDEDGGVDFGDRRPAVGSPMMFAPLPGNRRAVDTNLTGLDFDRALATGELWLYSKSLNRRFRLPSLKAVKDLLATCEQELIAAHGMSIEDQKRMAQPPEPERPFPQYFKSEDYPSAAIMLGTQGRVMARLKVDAEGRAISCEAVQPSGSEALDAKTCSVAMRAKFKPALDREGKPMPALHFFTIRWRLPR